MSPAQNINFDNLKIRMNSWGHLYLTSEYYIWRGDKTVLFTFRQLDRGQVFTVKHEGWGSAQINRSRDGYAISTSDPDADERKDRSRRRVLQKWDILSRLLLSDQWHLIEGMPAHLLEFARETNAE
jgi:hypothetical protein